MAHSQAESESSEVTNSYNTSVTQTLGDRGVGVVNAREGSLKIGNLLNVHDSFNSQDVSNFVANLGAGGSASGNPSASSSGSGDISKWIPWIALAGAAVLAYILVKKN